MRSRILTLALPVLLLACGGGDSAGPTPPPPPAPVATVTINPPSSTLLPQQTAQLAATTLDASGGVLSGRTITWSSSASAVATVNTSGLVTAVAPGTAEITATSEGRTGSMTATVLVPTDRVVIQGATSQLVSGQSTQLSARTLSQGGDTLAGRNVAWSTSAATVATVSSTGLVTAVGPGSADITATVESKNASVAVMVSDGGVVQSGSSSTITAANGDVRIEVPAGAAPAGLAISVIADTVLPDTLPTGSLRIGPTLYKFGPDGTQFTAPVTVTMKYDPATLPEWMPASRLRIQRWNGSAWNMLTDIVVDSVARTVSGKTMGFSTFGFSANLPQATLSPDPAQVNTNQRHVDLTVTVPGFPVGNFRYRWVTTGSNGSLITLSSDDTIEYFASTPIIPDGTIDLVGVEVSAQLFPGGPFVPIATATTGITSDLGLTYELNPWSQKVEFGESKNLEAIVRNRDGSVYQSQDLFYEYTATTNAGDVSPATSTRTQTSVATYTAWQASRQVKNPPRGEKITVKFIIRQSVWSGDAFGRNSVTFNFKDMGSADAFFEIGKDTYVGRMQVVTTPTSGGACVSANVYAPKVAPAPMLYAMKVTSINDPTLGTTFNKSWTVPTGSGIYEVADAGSEYRITLASGCATNDFAITFRQNLYQTNFGGAQIQIKITP